tara:strand:+ start:191 stop:565 length:375 start_codon:yes stop_codon:yes gene_type:complete
MLKNTNVSNNNNFNKSNLKFLKLISLILGILILVCIVLLIVGVIYNYEKIVSKKEIETNKDDKKEIIFYQPINYQLVSSSLGNNNQLLLRYHSGIKTILLVVDIKKKIIAKKISILKSDDWGID